MESFIRSIHELSEHRNFGPASEEHREWIVVGIQDKELSHKLQLIPNLTLEMTVQETRQSEEVKAQDSAQGEAASAIQEVAHKRHTSEATGLDDIIVHWKNVAEHDQRLQLVIAFDMAVVPGHEISAEGLWPNLAKVSAINKLPPPDNAWGLKRVLGMVSYLGRYIANLAELGQLVYDLLNVIDEIQLHSRICIRENSHSGRRTVQESLRRCTEDFSDTHSDVECYVASIIDKMPASKQRMDIIRSSTA